MKKTKLVLDTNILIYGINEESKYFKEIRNLFELKVPGTLFLFNFSVCLVNLKYEFVDLR